MTDQLLGQTLAGKYRIKERWREDSVSQMYRAVQVEIDKLVTVKILNPALAERSDVANALQLEARILSRIASPYILNVLDFGKDERGTPFLALENAEGRSLREFIQEEGESSLERTIAIIRQIAEALKIAQSNNIFHGNLSSDNIMVAKRGETDSIKVLNFEPPLEADLNSEEILVRTDLPFYKSPEQFIGVESADARSDVYALGILLFEILTGKLPFAGENMVVLASKHLHDIPPSLIAVRPDLPPQVERVLQRALAKQPNQRFQSASEFSDSLANTTQIIFNRSKAPVADYDSQSTETQPAQSAEIRPIPSVERSLKANNPYKTAFIVLIGIVALSVLAIYTTGSFRNTPTQANSDPYAKPVQPLNPASSNGEDLGSLDLQSLRNNNANSALVSPGNIPPGGNPPPMSGGIPPGLYPSGGQTVVVPGNSNSIFMGDLNTNPNPGGSGSPNQGINANVRLGGNTNVTPSLRPANSNTGGSSVNSAAPTPAPTVAPIQQPTPRVVTPQPNTAPVKPNGTELTVKPTPSGAN